MKIGILTSGGDCQALNAAMYGLVRTLYKNISQHLGLRDGLKKIYKVIINLYDINLLYKFFPNKIFAINVADKG